MAIKDVKTDLVVDGNVSANTPTLDPHLTTKLYVDGLAGGSSTEYTITKSSHGFSVGDPVAEVSGVWVLADSSVDASTAEGVITVVPDVNTFKATIVGELTLTSHGYTVDTWYYLSETAGTFTSTVPSTAGDIIQFCFKVLDANTIYIRISQPEVVAAAVAPGVTVHNNLTGRSASDTHPTSAITGLDTALAGKEPALGDPATTGWLLSSTDAGVRSWIAAPNSAVWGGITGTLSAQTDLQSELDAKQDDLGNPLINGEILVGNIGGLPGWQPFIGNASYQIAETSFTVDRRWNYILKSAGAITVTFDESSYFQGNYTDIYYELGTPTFVFTKIPPSTTVVPPLIIGHTYRVIFGSTDFIMVDLTDDLGLPAGNGYMLVSTTAGVKTWVNPIGSIIDNDSGVSGATVSDALDDLETQIGQVDSNTPFILKTGDFNQLANENYIVSGTVEMAADAGIGAGVYTDLYFISGTLTFDWEDGSPSPMPPLVAGHLYRIIRSAAVWEMFDLTDTLSFPASNGQVLASTTAGVKSWVTLGSSAITNQSGVPGATVTDALEDLESETSAANLNRKYTTKTTTFAAQEGNNYAISGTTEMQMDSEVTTGSYNDIYYISGTLTFDWDDTAPSPLPALVNGHIYRIIRYSGVWEMYDLVAEPDLDLIVQAVNDLGTGSGNLAIPLDGGNIIEMTLTGNTTITGVTNLPLTGNVATYLLNVDMASTYSLTFTGSGFYAEPGITNADLQPTVTVRNQYWLTYEATANKTYISKITYSGTAL